MTITKHGLRAPIDQNELYGVRAVYNEETGMNGGLFTTEWPLEAGTRFFLTTEHEDVGLVTWYEAPSLEEANSFLDNLKNVEVERAVQGTRELWATVAPYSFQAPIVPTTV